MQNSSSNEGPLQPEEGFEHVPRSILDRAGHLLGAAQRREQETSGREVYVKHDALAVPGVDTVTILLTRTGQPLLFEEERERLRLYFPVSEEGETILQPEIIWVEHILSEGKRTKVSVTIDGISSYIGDVDQLVRSTPEIGRPCRREKL